MHPSSQLALNLDAPSVAAPRWFVTNGAAVVGPIATNLLLRGVSHGRVTREHWVREQAWQEWRAVERLREVRALRRVQARRGWAWRPTPDFQLPDVRQEACEVTREAVGLARDPHEVLLYGLQTAVAQTGSAVGLLHRFRSPWIGPVTSYAHGPGMDLRLGQVLPPFDPSFLAACAQRGVMGRALVGEAQRAVASRLENNHMDLKGVAMVPIVGFQRLLGLLELGRKDRGFRSADKSVLEGIALGIAQAVDGRAWA